MITHYRYVRVTERYTETLHVKKMADLVAVIRKFRGGWKLVISDTCEIVISAT